MLERITDAVTECFLEVLCGRMLYYCPCNPVLFSLLCLGKGILPPRHVRGHVPSKTMIYHGADS